MPAAKCLQPKAFEYEPPSTIDKENNENKCGYHTSLEENDGHDEAIDTEDTRHDNGHD